jgi:hypothetical protein
MRAIILDASCLSPVMAPLNRNRSQWRSSLGVVGDRDLRRVDRHVQLRFRFAAKACCHARRCQQHPSKLFHRRIPSSDGPCIGIASISRPAGSGVLMPILTPLASRFVNGRLDHHIYRPMHLDLSDGEAAALIRELQDIVESDRYPFSPRIRTLRAILGKLRPQPAREPLPPPPRHYEPPSKGRQPETRVDDAPPNEPVGYPPVSDERRHRRRRCICQHRACIEQLGTFRVSPFPDLLWLDGTIKRNIRAPRVASRAASRSRAVRST